MVSVCKQRRPGSVTDKSALAFVRKNAKIAFSLVILFGLGWGFGLAASGTPSEEATFTLQLLFAIFVGCQGTLIFVLHGIRKAEARDEWKKWFSSWTYKFCNGSKELDSTALSSKFYVTSPSSPKYISKTGALPTDTEMF